jgi:glycosyltransferase involved in cell wall biosynthesis
VLSQQYPNLEYIIIDGGSNDDSAEIIKKYEKHLTYWVSEKDGGQSDAINKGLSRCSGEIVNWINSDDWYQPGTLKKVNELFGNEKTLVVSGRGNVLQDGKLKTSNPGVDLYSFLEKTIGWARIDQPETFFRTSAIEKMGLLNTNLHYVMDREWWIRFLLLFGQENVLKTEDVFVNFRLHADSKSYKHQELFHREANSVYYTLAKQNELPESQLFQQHFDISFLETLPYKNIAHKEFLRRIVHYFWLLEARLYYAADNFDLAKKYLSLINKELLREEDAQEWSKLNKRIALVPVWLKKILNKR